MHMTTGRDAASAPGRLRARPFQLDAPVPGPGVYALTRDAERGLLLVPRARHAAGLPLVVFLHGAGGNAQQSLRTFGALAEENGVALIATSSLGGSWDGIRGHFGADIEGIDAALAFTFQRLPVDAGRIAIAGFSDGASYALSVGLLNGDLFHSVMAFSPGFVIRSEAAPVGRPRVYVAHGTEDRILPIDRTSRVLVPALRAEGYDVDYDEFDGPHAVEPRLARRALAALLE